MTIIGTDPVLYELNNLRVSGQRVLDDHAERCIRYQQYYDGEQDVRALIDTDERRTFRQFLRQARLNMCELIINAVAERLQVVGFRSEADPDNDSWAIWQDSQMDADSQMVQVDALVCGRGVVLVQPDDTQDSGVRISAESPLESCVLYEPGNRHHRLAGYKRFADYDHNVTEILITEDAIATWQPGIATPDVIGNPAGVVGMVELIPQPRTWGPPRSELHSAVPVQDRINTTIFNRLVATDYGAFRQIWATGIKLARQVIKDSDGTEHTRLVKPYDVGANRLLTTEDPAARFGSFPESTLTGYLASIAEDVQYLASITQTPPYYLLSKMVNISADAIKAAEAGLVKKVSRRALYLGEGWEEVMRTALTITGHPAGDDTASEVVWGDFETRSEQQRADALVKMATLGIPQEILWQRWGASPQEVQQWKQMAAAQQVQNAAATAASFASPASAYAQLTATAAQQPPQAPPAQ